MHGSLSTSLTCCFHGDRSRGFSALPVVLWKSPLGYLASLGTESLSWCPWLVTCMWNWSDCTWRWAGAHTQCLDWYGHSSLIARNCSGGWKELVLLLPWHQHIVCSELEKLRHEGLLSLSFSYHRSHSFVLSTALKMFCDVVQMPHYNYYIPLPWPYINTNVYAYVQHATRTMFFFSFFFLRKRKWETRFTSVFPWSKINPSNLFLELNIL